MLLCRVVSISFVFSINSEYNHCFLSRCLFVPQSSLKTKKYSVLGKSCFYTVHSNTIASIYSEIPLYRSIPSGPNKMFNIRRDSQVIISMWISWFCTTAHVHHRGDSSIEGVRFRGVSLYWENHHFYKHAKINYLVHVYRYVDSSVLFQQSSLWSLDVLWYFHNQSKLLLIYKVNL